MTEVETEGAGVIGWRWHGLLAFSLVIFLFCMASSLSHVARAVGLLHDWPVEPNLVIESPDGSPAGWSLVRQVPAGSPAERAGIQAGDMVRSDMFGVPLDAVVEPGVHLPVSVERDGAQFRAVIAARTQAPLPPGSLFIFGSQGVAGIVWATLGLALLLLRGRRDQAAAIFGALMISLAWTAGGFGFFWAFTGFMLQLRAALSIAAAAGICLFLPLAGLELAGKGPGPRERRIARGLSAVLAVANVIAQIVDITGYGAGTLAFIWTIIGAAVACFWFIVRYYRQNDARARNRIKVVLLAFGTYIVSFVLFVAFVATGQSIDFLWLVFASVTVGLAGPVLMAHAILRQRLFDFSFAVNRTLVYGAAAFTLLVTFGLVEYIAKSMIPHVWPTAGPFISAGIAVLLFLSFHRLHHWFEHHIERFFFRKWHEAEAELRRFVHSAGHFDKASPLCKSTVDAVSHYAAGAEAALYLRGAEGAFRRESGRLAGTKASYDSDDPAFALMRSERKPLELPPTRSALPGELALPMLEQGNLIGFVLLAGKADGTHYRPDERELLGWAVHHIGLDLRALHARQLEAQVVSLGEKLAWAEQQLAKRTKPKPA
jgi:hypothetical protein